MKNLKFLITSFLLFILPNHRDNLSVPVSMVKQSKKNLENGTDRLSRNVLRITNYKSRMSYIPEKRKISVLFLIYRYKSLL